MKRRQGVQVLIIGGTRRCGPYLVEALLKNGHSVVCYHRGQHNVSFSDEAKHLYGDRRNYTSFKEQMADLKADVVIDMIASDDRDVEAVAEAFSKRIQRYVCISTYHIYEAWEAAWNKVPSSQPVPIPEGAPKRKQLHPYGEEIRFEKLLMESAALEAQQRGDFPVTILRWPALYGPRDTTPREWYYVRQALDGRRQIAIPEGGQALFPRGYFENMAHTVALVVEHLKDSGSVYNAADVGALTLRQIVEIVGEVLEHRWEIISVPREWMPAAPRSQLLPYSCDPYDIEPHLLYDLTKIRMELGYSDLVPAAEGLEKTVRWLVDHHPPAEWLPISYPDLDEAIQRARAIN
jgi:nucleoside-diphosphate-sugar epimerase